jgi:hypothetical protein
MISFLHMLIGYARVSTDEQDRRLQIDALKREPAVIDPRGITSARPHRPTAVHTRRKTPKRRSKRGRRKPR